MIIKKKGKVAIYDGLRCSPGSDPQETKKVMIDSFDTAKIIKNIWKLMKFELFTSETGLVLLLTSSLRTTWRFSNERFSYD